MTDTPRTDENRWTCTDLDGMEKTRVGDWVEVDFARQLERENAELDRKNAALSITNLEICASLKEAHEQIDFWKKEVSGIWRNNSLLENDVNNSWRIIWGLRKVLRRIASTAGDPDPVQACRNIINLVKESGAI